MTGLALKLVQTDIYLPAELWSFVFLHLDLPGLRSTALTCRSFRWLTHSYLYRNLTIVCEYSWETVKYSFQTFQRKGLAQAFDRLQFFASPHIAPLVRTCSIRFQRWPDPDFVPILDLFCQNLSLFQNLQTLSFYSVLITAERAADISRSQPLKWLTLTDCETEVMPLSVKIRTEALSISKSDNVCLRGSKVRWLSLVDTNHLSCLFLVTSTTALEVLSEIETTEIVLPCLHSLHLNRERKVVQSSALSPALARCPALSRLHLLRKPEPEKKGELVVLPENFPTPRLLLYDGPHWMLPSLQGQRLGDLRRVRLFGDRWEGTCDMIGLRQDIKLLHLCCPRLESVHLRAFPTSDVCTTVANLFPSLQSLAFSLPLQTQAQDPMLALTREPFLESVINMTVPSNLKVLAILGMIFSDSDEGGKVIETLAAKYNSLQRIYLWFPQDFWMTWCRTPAMESCTIDIYHRGISISQQLDFDFDFFF